MLGSGDVDEAVQIRRGDITGEPSVVEQVDAGLEVGEVDELGAHEVALARQPAPDDRRQRAPEDVRESDGEVVKPGVRGAEV